MGNDGTRLHEGMSPDGDNANDDIIRVQRGSRVSRYLDLRSTSDRCVNSGELHARHAKDTVLVGHVVVDRDVILHLAASADYDLVYYENTLLHSNAAPDARTCAALSEVPGSIVIADRGTVIDDRAILLGTHHRLRPRTDG